MKKEVVFLMAGSVAVIVVVTYIILSLKSQIVTTRRDDGGKSIVELVQELKTESLQGVEYFNSSAFDSLVARNDTTSVNRLIKQITEPNRAFLLPLLALRQIDSTKYNQVDSVRKVSILVDALNQAKFFNAWGVPHRYKTQNPQQRETPAQAIIEMGDFAKPYLRPLLQEKRSAPVWGSGEIYDNYNYRVADFALALILAIDGDTTELPVTRAGRDSLLLPVVQ